MIDKLAQIKKMILSEEKRYDSESDQTMSILRNKKYGMFQITDDIVGSVALFLHLLVNGGVGILNLILMNFLHSSEILIFSEPIFFSFVGLQLLFVSGPLLYLANQEDKKINQLIDSRRPLFKEMRDNLKKLKTEYDENLVKLDIDFYMNMSMEDVHGMSNIEHNIIKDYKDKLENTDEGEVFKFLNHQKVKNAYILKNI